MHNSPSSSEMFYIWLRISNSWIGIILASKKPTKQPNNRKSVWLPINCITSIFPFWKRLLWFECGWNGLTEQWMYLTKTFSHCALWTAWRRQVLFSARAEVGLDQYVTSEGNSWFSNLWSYLLGSVLYNYSCSLQLKLAKEHTTESL